MGSKIKYSKYTKKALRIGNRIVLETVPDFVRDHLVYMRNAKKKMRNRLSVLRALDDKLYFHKYYPWCYKNYKPTVVYQGWYNVEYAKKKYLEEYGPDALKYVKFINGKKAIELGFETGESLYINGRWRLIRNKNFRPADYRLLNRKGTYLRALASVIPQDKRLTSRNKENRLIKQMKYYQYGKKKVGHLYKVRDKKRSKLQEIREAKYTREKNFYEE